MTYRLLVLVLALVAIALAGCSDDSSTTPTVVKPGFSWSAVSPGTGNYLFDVCFDATGESYVAVGANGALIRSAHADQLSQVDSPTEADLFGVTYTGQAFVAVGDSATILRSNADGASWTKEDLGDLDLNAGDWLYGVASSGTQTIAVGHGGIILTSTEGSSWTRVEAATVPILANLYGITYQPDADLFVAVGAGGSIITSSNGTTWQWDSTLYTTAVLYDVTWAAELGLYIAVGQHGTIITSEDAHKWTVVESRPEGYFYAVEWSGDKLAIVGDDGWLLTSTDAETFTLRDARLQDWRGVRYSSARGGFVAVGLGQTIMGSADGDEWEIEFDGWQLDLNAIAGWDTDDTLCIAVGSQGTILKGSNGIDWGLCFSGPNVCLNGLTGRFGTDTMIVAVGDLGTILTSADLETWDTVLSKPVLLNLNAVVEGPAGFAAVGDNGTVLHSNDGVSWALVTDLAVSEQDLYGIAASQGNYVAVGDSGTVLTSTNGQQWVSGSVGLIRDLSGVSWLDTMFVAVGDSGAVYTSSDGSSWSEQQWYTDDTVAVALTAIAGSDNAMVAVGLDGGWLVSEDGGLNWTSFDRTVDFRGIVWTGDKFVAVGAYGTIITSP
ncbi:MAG: hypothetical protein ABIE70_11270 [bacterium]